MPTLLFMSFFTQIIGSVIYPYAQIILRNMGFSQTIVGIIISLGQLAACIAPLFIGNIADKTGKNKRFYFVAILIIIICYNMIIRTTSLVTVILLYVLSYSFVGCVAPLSDSIISNGVRKNGGNYATYRATGTIGYVLALVLFSVFSFPSEENNNQIILALTCSGLLLLLAILLHPEIGEPAEKKEKKEFFKKEWFNSGFYLFIFIMFFQRIGATVVEKMFSSFMTETLNLGNKFTFLVALGACSEFIFMLIAGRWLSKGKISEYTLMMLSCVGLIIRLLICSFTRNVWVFALSQLLHCLTYGAAHISIISYIGKTVKTDHSSLATAIYASIANSFAQFLGSFAGGFIIDNMGYPALFRIYAVFPVIAAGLCVALKKRIFTKPE